MLLAGGLVLLAFAALFWRWFQTQGLHSWNSPENWGHAFFTPVIALALIWRRRGLVRSIPPAVFWPGVLPFLVGIACYMFAVLGIKNHMLQGFSVILTLFGVLLLLLGPAMMRVLFLPVSFLVFGVTLSDKIMIELTFELQRIASFGSWVMLSVIGAVSGFRVDLAGNTLEIITGSGEVLPLNVAEACSGMRMVVAFYALAAAAALWDPRPWWQRVTLLLVAGPVAIFMNMVRVAVLGLLTLFDPDLAAGSAHTLIGTLLLIPSLGVFAGLVWVLDRLFVRGGQAAGGAS